MIQATVNYIDIVWKSCFGNGLRETAPLLTDALRAGCGIVLANKRALSGSWDNARKLYEYADLRYEATVGAGLPVIGTLRSLLATGDQIECIEGCMSGTLGYLASELECGRSFSAAVTQARSMGYTEPDPREDLSGRDVARKTLILARTAGWPLELPDLTIETLYPDDLAGIPLEEFLDELP